jgi:hypothetical protein
MSILKCKSRVVDNRDKCHPQCPYWDKCMGHRNRTGKCPQWAMMSRIVDIATINRESRRTI